MRRLSVYSLQVRVHPVSSDVIEHQTFAVASFPQFPFDSSQASVTSIGLWSLQVFQLICVLDSGIGWHLEGVERMLAAKRILLGNPG